MHYFIVADFQNWIYDGQSAVLPNCLPVQWFVKLLATLLITIIIKWNYSRYFIIVISFRFTKEAIMLSNKNFLSLKSKLSMQNHDINVFSFLRDYSLAEINIPLFTSSKNTENVFTPINIENVFTPF